MRLSVEETLRNLKQVEEKYKIRFTPTGEVNISEMAQDCIDTIEALQQENEQLKADLRGKDNEINDLEARIEYLRKFKPKKNGAVREGSV